MADKFKIIISPAKSMNFDSKFKIEDFSTPLFLDQSEKIMKVLRKKSPKKLFELMGISESLANLNWNRNQTWTKENTLENAKQAISAFTGDVYVGLDVDSLSEKEIDVLNEKLYILSGLYGVLRPLDLIQPYRLEMGSKLPIGSKANLYQFWKNELVNYLNTELTANDWLINLTSNEYFKVIDTKKLSTKNIITPEFKDYKNGELKIIGFFAKKARGLMVRFIVQNNIETIEGLKLFNIDGYAFDARLSTENKFVYTR